MIGYTQGWDGFLGVQSVDMVDSMAQKRSEIGPMTRLITGRQLRWPALLALLLTVVATQGCNSWFYHPNSHLYRSVGAIEGAEELTFASKDGTRLNAWFLPALGEQKGTVVYFHGNALNLTNHISYVDWLPAHGFDVFIFDYRGFGKSEGSPSRSGIHEDSVAALEHVRSRDDVDADRILVFAQSLGGACATAALGESGIKVCGVALDSTFGHYISMGNELLGGTFWTYPLAWLLLSNSHSPADSIANLAPTPILCVHSLADPLVPIRQGRALYEAALEPKAFWEVPARGHPIATSSQATRQRLLQFFVTCLPD